MATAISLPANEITEPNLKQRLARAERVNKLKSQALILSTSQLLVEQTE